MRWSTFLRLHAQGIIACDFFLSVTATFRQLYVFVVIEHRSRRLIHCNVIAHPPAAWTLQQSADDQVETSTAKTASNPRGANESGSRDAYVTKFLRTTGVYRIDCRSRPGGILQLYERAVAYGETGRRFK
jgi:hypothetical protein